MSSAPQPMLRLVRPPIPTRSYARLGEAMVRLAEFATTYHLAQAGKKAPAEVVARLPRAITSTGMHLRLVPGPVGGLQGGSEA